jgi:hypothetical protein
MTYRENQFKEHLEGRPYFQIVVYRVKLSLKWLCIRILAVIRYLLLWLIVAFFNLLMTLMFSVMLYILLYRGCRLS